MPKERFYTEHVLEVGSKFALSEEESRHIKVMRLRLGDEVELVNGRGSLAVAAIDEAAKNSVTVQVRSVEVQERSNKELVLLQALPRPNRLDTILEKTTELGVTEILLFPGEKSERDSLSEQQMRRAEAIVLAAMKQCGRLFMPKLGFLPEVKKWEVLSGLRLFGDVSPRAKPLWRVLQEPLPDKVYFCVGPEAGLAEREEAVLLEQGFKGVSLHPNILRTDTAPICALSIISHARLCFDLLP